MTAVSEHPLTDGDTVATGLLREAAIRRLLLHERGECSTEHVRLVASCVGAHERTVWRWLHNAHNPGRTAVERFTITDELRVRLAYFRGNASALRRDLLTQADDPALVPSLTTLYRAIHRDLTEASEPDYATASGRAAATTCSSPARPRTATLYGKATTCKPQSRSTCMAAWSSRGSPGSSTPAPARSAGSR
jgi:hypothetical protein